MRHFRVPTTPFTRAVSDSSRQLKDRLIVPDPDSVETAGTVGILGNEQIDHVAVRLFGLGAEYQWFVLANKNFEEVVGWKLNSAYILNMTVPNPAHYTR